MELHIGGQLAQYGKLTLLEHKELYKYSRYHKWVIKIGDIIINEINLEQSEPFESQALDEPINFDYFDGSKNNTLILFAGMVGTKYKVEINEEKKIYKKSKPKSCIII
jgi:hypothetical protein